MSGEWSLSEILADLRAAVRPSWERVRDVVMDQPGTLTPPKLRSLDGVLLAAASSLGDDPEMVTYELRMVAAASACGLLVSSPT